MADKEYSNVIGEDKVKSRYGCSVCPKKVTNGVLIVNSSSNSNKQLLNKKKNGINDTNSKYKDNGKSKIITGIKSRSKVDECYCNHMEEIKKKYFPKVLCSKRFKIPILDVNEDWLNEITEFRRENWFDCHSDSFTDAICLNNINPSNSLSNLTLNCNHLNDSILLNYTECNELKNEPIMYGDGHSRVKHGNVKKKSTEQKSIDKKKGTPNSVCKPWIPPSFNFL